VLLLFFELPLLEVIGHYLIQSSLSLRFLYHHAKTPVFDGFRNNRLRRVVLNSCYDLTIMISRDE
jgi:hypothetical protein